MAGTALCCTLGTADGGPAAMLPWVSLSCGSQHHACSPHQGSSVLECSWAQAISPASQVSSAWGCVGRTSLSFFHQGPPSLLMVVPCRGTSPFPQPPTHVFAESHPILLCGCLLCNLPLLCMSSFLMGLSNSYLTAP